MHSARHIAAAGNPSAGNPAREGLPHESPKNRPAWLPSLHKAQAVVDSGMRLALRGERLLRPDRPACAPGCAGCCSRRQPQATALEAAGALLHLGALGASPVLDRFLAGQGLACPFLEGGLCAVYPARPLSCRQLVVFGRSCGPGEDPRRVRPGDVLTPLRGHALRAYSLLLPHLGGPSKPGQEALPPEMLGRFVRPLSALDREQVLELAGLAARKAA